MNNKFFPSNFLFITIMFLGTFLSLSSSHWLTMWMGLELNLMGFLPLINIKGKMLEAEASMKYFIIQSLSSSVLIISSIMMYFYTLTWYSMFTNNLMALIIIMSLVLKLGGAPMHFWMPSVTKKMSWMVLFMLLTWQKVAPLFMLSLFNSTLYLVLFIAISSTLIGSLMAVNQTNIQLILTYSSISHLGWMLSMITLNSSLTLIYFTNYIIISTPLFMFFSSNLGDYLFMLTKDSSKDNLMIASLIMSLAGLPPLMGFMSKLIILTTLMQFNMIMLSLMLFLGALIGLYFYLNMCLMLLIKSFTILSSTNTRIKFNSILSLNLMSTFIIYPLVLGIVS